MIIIEGPDNSGKSTLCNQLSKHFQIEVIHSGGPGKDFEEIIHRTDSFISAHKQICIRDRFPAISDKVYASILRDGQTVFTDPVYKKYMEILIGMHPVIILCWPEYGTMMNLKTHQRGLFDDDELWEGVKANQEKIIEMYDNLFQEIPHIKYSYEDPYNLDTIKQCISTQLINMKGRKV